QISLARTDDGVEGGHRAARREQTARVRGKAHPVAQPVERVGLELDERRRGLPDAGKAIRGVGDEVCQRGGIHPAAGNEGEIPGTDRRERSRNPLAKQAVEQRLQRNPLFGSRFDERSAERGGVDVTAARLLSGLDDVFDTALDDGRGHRVHLAGGELEIYWSQSFTR